MIRLNYCNDTFRFYFYFIQERMNIFWSRRHGGKFPWTLDPILQKYRFTNVYRASDRVSQYLIKNVIYSHLDLDAEDIILRIIIFKIFNKVETWEYIEKVTGEVSTKNFNVIKICETLSERRRSIPIFNNAYMMTGTHSLYNHLRYKHEKWLTMVKKELLDSHVIAKIVRSKSLRELYSILKTCSFIGDFIAYQYAIDLNYSPFFCFDENSFVKAGIGAIRGIKKCFNNIEKKDYEKAIEFTLLNFNNLQQEFGFTGFKSLFSRNPTLIDLQNCFCETDKYMREKLPALLIDNKRIKQRFAPNFTPYDLFFPPTWKLHTEKCDADD